MFWFEGEDIVLEDGLCLIVFNGFIFKWVCDCYFLCIEDYGCSFFLVLVIIVFVIGSGKVMVSWVEVMLDK